MLRGVKLMKKNDLDDLDETKSHLQNIDLDFNENDWSLSKFFYSDRNNECNFKDYQVNDRIMKIAKKKAVFMHCLPAYRGKEVTNNVIDGRQSIVWEQAKNRIYVQQAILYYILN